MKRPMLSLDSVIVLEIAAGSVLYASLVKAGTPAKPDCAPNLEFAHSRAQRCRQACRCDRHAIECIFAYSGYFSLLRLDFVHDV